MNHTNHFQQPDARTIETDVYDAAFRLKDCSPEQLQNVLSVTDEQSRNRILHGIELVRAHGKSAFKFGLSTDEMVALPVDALKLGS